MKKPCLDCGRLSDAHRCPEHLALWQQRQEQYRTAKRPTTRERGYDSRWRRLARAHLLAHPECLVCGTSEDLTVDHIVPLARGGESTLDNLQTLCRRHNAAKGAR